MIYVHNQAKPIKYYGEKQRNVKIIFFLPYEHAAYDSFSIKIYEINYIWHRGWSTLVLIRGNTGLRMKILQNHISDVDPTARYTQREVNQISLRKKKTTK